MERRILLFIKDEVIKTRVLKYLIKEDFDVVEVNSFHDLSLKLQIYPPGFMLFLIEIGEDSRQSFYESIEDLRRGGYLLDTPILGVLPKSLEDELPNYFNPIFFDFFLVPESNQDFNQYLSGKIDNAIKVYKGGIFESEYGAGQGDRISEIKEIIDLNIRYASRGNHPLSILMIKLHKVSRDKINDFIDRINIDLRGTDTNHRLDDESWIIVCPYTKKKHVYEVERKIFGLFKAVMGNNYDHRRINIFAVTYPDDATGLEDVLKLLQTGIENSMTINTINRPLKDLSKEELEQYKEKIQKYRNILTSFLKK